MESEDNKHNFLDWEEHVWRKHVDQRLNKGDAWMANHQQALIENTEITKRIDASTSEMVEAFKFTRSGVRAVTAFGRFIHTLAKWAAPIVIFCAAVWALIHGKMPPGE
jgi:hypothetical protein